MRQAERNDAHGKERRTKGDRSGASGTRFRPLWILPVLALLTGAPALSAQSAQSGPAPGWTPWSGCWEVVADMPDDEESFTCIRPTESFGGAELVTFDQDMEASEPEALRADGQPRSTEREGCRGTDRAEFSGDGGRVYLRSDYTCPGGLQRASTGIFAMITPYEWLDVRTVEAGGDVRTWTRRYRRLDETELEDAGLEDWADDQGLSGETARFFASDAPSIDDVIEASARVHSEAVKAWIAEQNDPLPVDAGSLVRMAEAGVPGDVTDLVVAVSFPDRFVVAADGSLAEADPWVGGGDRDRPTRTIVSGIGFRGSRGYYHRGRYYYGWSPYDSYYRPWGYAGYGWGYGYAYRPSVVYVQPRSAPAEAGGRIVNGRGYTRPGSSGARPSGSGSGSGRPSTSSGRGDGGSVSSSGGYRGGSSGSTGRTARPRSDGDN